MTARHALGLGIGWRPATTALMLQRTDLGFVEVVAEHVPRRSTLPRPIEAAIDRGLTIVAHGIKLSLGSVEVPRRKQLARLSELATRLDSPVVSEHAAFVRAGRHDIGHLTPLPRTRDALAVLCRNIRIAQSELPVPLAIENPAALFAWPEDELDEATFFTELTERTGCSMLLDLANLHVSCINRGGHALELLDRLPLERVAYVHVAGGVVRDGLLHDTHARRMWPAVERLVSELAARTTVPGILLERDDDFPPMRELDAELDRLKVAWLAPALAAGAQPVSTALELPHAQDASARLDRSERSLAAALVRGASPPAGFDAHRVAVAREAVQRKRARERVR
jgi:uncharacterized protein (UPF0276 family)